MRIIVKQVGGDHYGDTSLMHHWDLMVALKVGYVVGCATKYLARWPNKNPDDLAKARSYVEKAKLSPPVRYMPEVGDYADYTSRAENYSYYVTCFNTFVTQHNIVDAQRVALYATLQGDFVAALKAIEYLEQQEKNDVN